MARKSRKHPELAVPGSKDTVGYIRLSVFNRDPNGSMGWMEGLEMGTAHKASQQVLGGGSPICFQYTMEF